MNVSYLSLRMKGFKAAKDVTIDFRNPITIIRGRNRTGKTTIADAISWCLFGKDSKGNTKFGLKTRENGVEIPHIEHSVILTIDADGQQYTIRRSIREKYDLDDRCIGNTTEYHIDGTPYTAADFSAFVQKISPEDIYRTLSTPTAFPSLDWKVQRAFLVEMCGLPTADEITQGNPKFSAIQSLLQEQDVISQLQHLSYQIRETKKQIDIIPVRIEEQKKVLPDVQGTTSEIEERLQTAEKELQEMTTKLASLKSGSEDVKNQETRRQIEFQQKRIDNMMQSARIEAQRLYDEYQSQLNEAKRVANEVEINKTNLAAKRNSLVTLHERTKKTLEDYNSEKLIIRSSWQANKERHFTPSDDSLYCPTCHQPLPEDQARETIIKAREEFNLSKERVFKALTEKANTLKENIAKAEQMIADYEKEMKETTDALTKNASEIVKAQKALNEIKPPKTAEQILSENDNYKQALEKLSEKQKQLEQPQEENSDIIRETEEQEQKGRDEARNLTGQLALAKQRDTIENNISKLQEEKKQLVTHLDELTAQKILVEEYQQRADNLLEERVNSRFQYVRFTLFRTYLNGTREPFCQCSHDGIPFTDLNSADQLNAGIDIIKTLSHYYGVSVPLIIDNAESVNDILQTESQQIRLYVSEDKQLITE